MKEVDRDIFKKAKTIQEVYALSRELKGKGYDAAEVNQFATKRKKELVTSINSVNTLVKVLPKSGILNRNRASNFIIEVNDLNAGKIVLTKEGKVIL